MSQLFRDLPIDSTFRFEGDSQLPGSGCFLHQNVYRKTGNRTYMPADVDAATKSLHALYKGYPDILRTLKGKKLHDSLTLRVGSVMVKTVAETSKAVS